MQLFRFANPDFLYLLLLLPLMLLLFIINILRRKRALRKLGRKELVTGMMPGASTNRPAVKFLFQSLALLSAVIMLARPQFGSKIEEVRRQGVEVIIALDVSNSMLASDIPPDRLTRAKQAISRLVDNLADDRIGLFVFAGDAYTQLPVTTDYVSAKMFLSMISPDMVPRQGTAIGAAINLGISSFSPGEDKSKAMIIITDGENHEDDPHPAAEAAAEKGIVIHAIGIGSIEGVPIQISSGTGRDFLKDAEGNTVITRLDEDVIRKIAATTGGTYVRAGTANIGLDQIYNEISKMKKDELESRMFTEYNDQFHIFAAFTLILLVAEFLIMDRKNRVLEGLKLFRLKV